MAKHESAYFKLWQELAERLGAEEAAALKQRFAGWVNEDAARSRRQRMESEIRRLEVLITDRRNDDPVYYADTIKRHEGRIARLRQTLAKPMYQFDEGGSNGNTTTTTDA